MTTHTMACRKLSADIDQADLIEQELSAAYTPALPEVGEELDELDDDRDDLVEEQRRLHESGEMPGRYGVKPVWLLDVDGVINAASKKPDTSIWPAAEWRTARVLRLPLLVASPVVRFICEQHEAGRVEVRWHTTWQDDAPKVAEEFGLPAFPVADCPEFNSRLYDRAMNGRDTAWWKRPAVDRVLVEEQRPLIWTDDDVSRREADQVRALGVALVIAPNSYTGLTPKHLRQIGEFLDLHSPGAVAREGVVQTPES